MQCEKIDHFVGGDTYSILASQCIYHCQFSVEACLLIMYTLLLTQYMFIISWKKVLYIYVAGDAVVKWLALAT